MRVVDDADILAGALYMQWYNAPNGFCFDYLWCVDDPIIDDKRSVEYNVERRVCSSPILYNEELNIIL